MTHADTAAVAAFVQHEARLLDDRDYEAWLALYEEDARYWAPVSPEQGPPGDGLAHFNDDKQLMMARTHRLVNPRAFGAEPAPRTVHVLSGTRIEGQVDGLLVASSAWIMLEYRARGGFERDKRSFGGRVTHRLRARADGWGIVQKRIDLIDADAAHTAILAPF